MYHEFRDAGRTGWKYTYKGAELLRYAEARLAFHQERAAQTRADYGRRVGDRTVKLQDDESQKLLRATETHASLAEQCEVFVHEFRRSPEREFQLALGDVVFFGLAGHAPAAGDDD